METAMNYLERFGGESLLDKPFTEVDNLILCKLVCPNWTGFVPGPDAGESVTLQEAAAAFLDGRRSNRLGLLISPEILPMIRLAAASRRFGSVQLSRYVNRIDEEKAEQFSALCLTIEDGSRFIAFRGTDDTLTGWKENFNMSFLTAVPAQLEAVSYLTAAARGEGLLRVGGHSKGGNLAVYASVFCPEEVQRRILAVYNNDGPGFSGKVLESEAYQRIRGRVNTLVPQSSIVGMLLEHEEIYEVVKSGALGPVQHDVLTWEVAGDAFIHLPSTTRRSQRLDRTLKAWVDSVDNDTRRSFTDALFDILYATGAKTLTELTEDKLSTAHALLKGRRSLSFEQKEALHRTLSLLWEAARQSREPE